MLTKSSPLIGVAIAVTGNIVVSFALNLQKYVHTQLEEENELIENQQKKQSSSQPPSSDAEPRETSSLLNHDEQANEVKFYQKPLWWLGLILMFGGEIGNFLAYAFAPASIVAPLGTVALVANCFFAPIMNGEKFRKWDIVGIAFCIVGATVVILSSNGNQDDLTPKQLLEAARQPPFIIYTVCCVLATVVFYVLSFNKHISKYVCTEAYMCSLCGGFTVLSTKAFTTFLKTMGWAAFKDPVVMGVLFILLFTAVVQIIFLQWALSKYESKVIVPTQFCSFSFCAVLGSAILFNEFANAPKSALVKFILGCISCAVGVIWITWSSGDDDPDQVPLDEGAQEQVQDQPYHHSHSHGRGGHHHHYHNRHSHESAHGDKAQQQQSGSNVGSKHHHKERHCARPADDTYEASESSDIPSSTRPIVSHDDFMSSDRTGRTRAMMIAGDEEVPVEIVGSLPIYRQLSTSASQRLYGGTHVTRMQSVQIPTTGPGPALYSRRSPAISIAPSGLGTTGSQFLWLLKPSRGQKAPDAESQGLSRSWQGHGEH